MVIAQGYPKDNVILAGMVSICAGQDPELAVAVRDEQLPCAEMFIPCAVEAACWIEDDILRRDLFEQILAAMEHLDDVNTQKCLELARWLALRYTHLAELVQRMEET